MPRHFSITSRVPMLARSFSAMVSLCREIPADGLAGILVDNASRRARRGRAGCHRSPCCVLDYFHPLALEISCRSAGGSPHRDSANGPRLLRFDRAWSAQSVWTLVGSNDGALVSFHL